MKSEILHRKLERYVKGESMPAETRQIQTWLSCTSSNAELTPEQRSLLELEILHEIQAYTAYPLFFPQKRETLVAKGNCPFLIIQISTTHTQIVKSFL